MLSFLGIRRNRTTAYHPQANGLIERAHSTLKNSLRCLIGRSSDWESALPVTMMAIRSAFNENNTSPALMMFGEAMTLPSTLFSNKYTYDENDKYTFLHQLRTDLQELHNYVLKHDDTLSDLQAPKRDFNYNYVFIENKAQNNMLSPKYEGPYRITHNNFPVLTVDRNGVPYNVNVDRCKPVFRVTPELSVPVQEAPVCPVPPRPIPEVTHDEFNAIHRPEARPFHVLQEYQVEPDYDELDRHYGLTSKRRYPRHYDEPVPIRQRDDSPYSQPEVSARHEVLYHDDSPVRSERQYRSAGSPSDVFRRSLYPQRTDRKVRYRDEPRTIYRTPLRETLTGGMYETPFETPAGLYDEPPVPAQRTTLNKNVGPTLRSGRRYHDQ